MGKLIRCASKIAEKPFCFCMTKTNVYSIEEVCFYIRNNIYMMQEEVFDQAFAVWLREELGMKETADKLEMMNQDHRKLKDIVVTLCCSCDYYNETQINELIEIMDQTQNLSLRGRSKIKADSFLKSGSLDQARKEYEMLLQSDDMLHGTPEEYGMVYHSLGVTFARMGEFLSAADAFRKAYEQNQRLESMQSYLYSLLLAGKEDSFLQASREMELPKEQISFLTAQYAQVVREAREAKEYRRIVRLQEKKENNRQEFWERSQDLIRQWKQEYRLEMEN